MITPLKLKFPLRVRLPVTIRVPCPVGLPGPRTRSPSTKVRTPSGLLAPRPAELLMASVPLVKYRPWLMAEFFIPSEPSRNDLALVTDERKLGVFVPDRTAGSPG